MQYSKTSEIYDLYSIISCTSSVNNIFLKIKDPMNIIKAKAKSLIKATHPDKVKNADAKDNTFFNLVTYASKILTNYITKAVYDNEGHRGLKIYFLNFESDFCQILEKFSHYNLNEESEDLYVCLKKVLKKLRKIKFDLIKLNFQKYSFSFQTFKQSFDFSDYILYNEDNFLKEENASNFKNFNNLNDPLSIFNHNSNTKAYNNNNNNNNNNKSNDFSSFNLIKYDSLGFQYKTVYLFKKSNFNYLSLNLKNNYSFCTKTINIDPKLSLKYKSKNLNFKNFKNLNLKFSTKHLFKKNSCKIFIENYNFFLKELYLKPQVNFVKSKKEKNAKVNLKIGNQFKDEFFTLKTYFKTPKNVFYIKSQANLRDLNDTALGFKCSNLNKFGFLLKSALNNEISFAVKYIYKN